MKLRASLVRSASNRAAARFHLAPAFDSSLRTQVASMSRASSRSLSLEVLRSFCAPSVSSWHVEVPWVRLASSISSRPSLDFAEDEVDWDALSGDFSTLAFFCAPFSESSNFGPV